MGSHHADVPPSGTGGSRRPIGVSVVIPTWNEARNIGAVLRAMPACVDEIVLVDGGSVDGTVDVARVACPDIVVVGQGRRGKGNALAAGFEAARGRYVVMLDADGSMDPAEITGFLAALDQGAYYAKGTRFRAGGGSDDISRLRRLGNLSLNAITNVLYRTSHTDLCYGYNAFRQECITELGLEPAQDGGAQRWGDGFEIETVITIRIAKARLPTVEIPSFEHPRRHGASNLNTFRDGWRVLRTILRERRHEEGRARSAGVETTSAAAAPVSDRQLGWDQDGSGDHAPDLAATFRHRPIGVDGPRG